MTLPVDTTLSRHLKAPLEKRWSNQVQSKWQSSCILG